MTTNTQPWIISRAFSKAQRRCIEIALECALENLELPDIRLPIPVSVLGTRIPRVPGQKLTEGRASVRNGYAFIEARRDLYNWDLANTISHEIMHIDQFLTRRLIVGPGIDIWKGKLYRTSPQALKRMSVRKYNQLPWEAEANAYADYYFRKNSTD